MATKASHHELTFKPHMKTHQSTVIGEWLRDADVKAITVSSVKMARYFANDGWNDITIAFPCNVRQLEEIEALASEVQLTLLINSLPVAIAVESKLSQPVDAYIEINTGSDRTGLKVTQPAAIENLITYLKRSKNIHWKGFYSHPGHSYSARSQNEILDIHRSVLEQLHRLRNFTESEFGNAEICIGDTPCCSVAENFDGIDAISPGNFVFYDLMQHQIGSCKIKDIAIAMACPVVDTFPDRNQLAIYGGAIHFSKEFITEDGVLHFGRVASESESGWKVLDQTYLKAISQEHGLVQCSSETFRQFSPGDLLTILPVHSCLTAHLMQRFHLEDGREIWQMSAS